MQEIMLDRRHGTRSLQNKGKATAILASDDLTSLAHLLGEDAWNIQLLCQHTCSIIIFTLAGS
eukprot:scaffold157200_cov56-Attheya_sp.AAC.2